MNGADHVDVVGASLEDVHDPTEHFVSGGIRYGEADHLMPEELALG